MSIIKISKKPIISLYQNTKPQTQLRKNYDEPLDSYTITNFLNLNYNIKVSISKAYQPIKKLNFSTTTNSKPFIKTKRKLLYNDLK